MEDLAADFIIQNNSPIEFDAEISESEHFDCSFEIFASGTTWGSISGTLANQTDLQNALDLKADKSDVESVTGALADSIQAVDNKYDSITSGLDDSITAIDNKYDSITGALDDKFDSITGGLSDSISAIDSTIGGYGDIVNYNAADFATSIQGALADTAVQPSDLATVAFSGDYTDLINKPSIPTVNDGQLTIQVNGSNLATFTANQGTDTIANISIPNAAAWGNITGTLSDQTDLQNALDAKVTNNATGTKALAVGNTSQSTAEGGVAIGYGARANSTYATAIGEEARANNTNTTVIGKAAKATEARAIAIGSGAEANAQDAIAIKGINNTANTFQVYTYNMLDMSTGLIPDARISSNIARAADIPTFDTNQMAAINSGANTTNIGQIATNTQDISDEITNRQNADNGLQSQIDALVVASDVFDIVGTYAELQAYDISTVPVNDIIKVLVDSTHNDAATYYRCTESGGVKSWTYIGSEGAYYTKGEADSKFALQTTTVNGHALSSNITLTASDVGALPDSTVIPTVNNSSITFQKNGTDFDTITLNQSSNDTINISVPTDTSDLTNGAGYITGINSTDVINALGYTPYSDANPDGYISGITSGDVTTALGYTPYDANNPDGYITSAALTSYVDLSSAQNITGTKTFIGQKKILFKQSSSSDKLGFTLYNSSNTELGALEYRPNTISGAALLNLNCPYTADYVGFRYWGTAVNIIAPKVATAGDYYIPVNITDGNTTVTANNTGTVNISSLLTGYLQNTATGTNSLTIFGTPTTNTKAVNIGYDSVTKGTESIAIGYSAEIDSTNGAFSIAIGSYAKTNVGSAVAIGSGADVYGSGGVSIGSGASANGSLSLALGTDANAMDNSSIQIGYGINSDSNTLSVGFYNDSTTHYNWQLLDGTTGLIPDARISSNIARTSAIPTYSDFTGADSVTAGASGLVPAPSAGDEDKILTGGGSWESITTALGYTPVNKAGDTMTGDLAIQGSGYNTGLKLKSTDYDRTTTPTENKYSPYVNFLDENGLWTGGLYTRRDASVNNRIVMAVANASGTTATIICQINDNGNTYTSCPSPSASSDTNNIATTKWVNDLLYYRAGDTVTSLSNYIVAGYLTSSKTRLRFSIPLPKRMNKINTVTINTLVINARQGQAGYLPSATWNAKTGSTVSASFTDNMLQIECYSTTAFTSFTNNVIVNVEFDSFKCTFS